MKGLIVSSVAESGRTGAPVRAMSVNISKYGPFVGPHGSICQLKCAFLQFAESRLK